MGRNAVKKRAMPHTSKSDKASPNRAGGTSFDITNPAVKLIVMTGGSFFMEPRYYNGDSCIPVRNATGKLGKLQERLTIAKDTALKGSKAVKVENCEELDDVSLEIIAAAWDILNSENPSDLLKIAHWLRREMYIRLTPQVLLTLASQHPNGQAFVREYTPKIVSRPDEIKTVILMHRFFFGMKNLKNCLSRGLADALANFGERGLIKYEGKGFPSWKDVLFMVHRKKDFPLTKEQFEYFAHGKVDEKKTPIAHARSKLVKCSSFGTRAKKYVKDSFANWEVVLSQFGTSPESKKEVWEYLIDQKLVGYMAMMRNIRNLLEAGVGSKTIDSVCQFLSNPEQVKRSRQLPFRFAMAREVLQPTNTGYGYSEIRTVSGNGDHKSAILEALEDAVDYAAENVPMLPGTTVVFADNSGSMSSGVSGKSKVSCALAANILAGICAKRSDNARIVAFGTEPCEVSFTKNTHVLDFVEKLARANTQGMGTDAYKCVKWMMKNNIEADRVILLSDMQCWSQGGGWGRNSNSFCDEWMNYRNKHLETWLHTVNLHGYGDSVVEGNDDRVNLVGGFSEKILTMLLVAEGVVQDAIPSLEQIREQW